MLSPKEWVANDHEPGEKWTIKKIHDVHNSVKSNIFPEILQNIKVAQKNL
jgi:hypothetical protein